MLTNAKLVHQPHDHERCIKAALSRAKDLCAEQNVRLTTTRELVLRLLWQSHQPLGAYQLQDQLLNISINLLRHPLCTELWSFYYG